MSNFVRFFDSVEMKALEVPKEAKDYYSNPTNTQGSFRPLRVRIAATHAGKVTRNNGFYLPDKMKMGVSSFTDQYPKPIQVHHQSTQDPIGRAIKARYIDISRGFHEITKDSYSADDYTMLSALIDGDLSFQDAVDFVTKHFINDLALNNDPDYEGLGYIELIAEISDYDAIQKILDGRYLTGSTGAVTNQAICSVCKRDWASDAGKCKHKPGKIYDSAKCVLIAGNLTYDEYSFVNKPADRHSRIIEVNINGIQDFVTIDEQIESIPEISLVIDQSKSREDQTMTFKDAFALVSQDEKFKGLEKLEDLVKKIVDENKDLTEEQFLDLLSKELPDTATEPEEKDEVKLFWGDEYNEIVGDDEWGREYAEMMMSDDSEIKDAKLTAASRKKLPSSVFCKPPRGYPVHDCGHAKSAMAYAKKNNESSSVVACIRRKAARLGCSFDSKKNDEVNPVGQFDPGYFDHFEDEEMLQLRTGLAAALEERQLDSICPELQNDDRVKELEQELEAAKKNEDSVLQERLDAARKEIRYLHSDIENLTNSMADCISEVREVHTRHIIDLRALSGQPTDFETISLELKDKTGEEIKEIFKDLSGKVDMQKIADTLNSGLSKSPTDTVPDPTLTQDNLQSNLEDSQKQKLTDAMKKTIELKWLQIRTRFGQKAADEFLEDCKSKGIIPGEWPIKDNS